MLKFGIVHEPVSEQAVDEETQKAMLAYYYKKQEDQKVGQHCRKIRS